jgi:hypothetical protein
MAPHGKKPPELVDHPSGCICPICGADKEFDLPEELLDKIEKGDVVLFAGSGISTENKRHCQSTFSDEIRTSLNMKGDISFPKLMTRYCAQVDGRIKLIEKIKQRLDYFKSFSDFYFYMSRFHRAVSPLYMIRDIVTTNWDDFFERECLVDAFVYDSDLAFLDAAPRRLLKIHGSITNFGSIVATEEDYRKSYKRLNDGPLGSHLKSLVARRTVIYVGYSLSDENFLKLLRNVAKMSEPHLRQSYFVAPDIDIAKLKRVPIPLVPIETDGSYFFEKVHERLCAKGIVVRDEAFDQCDELLASAIDVHCATADAYERTQHPLLILALSYQDGLIHALKRVGTRRKSGEYHSPKRLHGLVHNYELKYDERRREKDFWNAAYAEGYMNGMMFLLMAHIYQRCEWPPMVSLPLDLNISTLPSLLRFPRKKIPRKARPQLERVLARCVTPSGEVSIPDHTPYL